MAKKGKTGANILQLMLDRIRLLQVCGKCLTEMCTTNFVLNVADIICKSHCNECLRLMTPCDNCLLIGHSSHVPALRACTKCVADGNICQKLAVYVLTLDCEEGNKQAMEEIMSKKESQTIDAEFMLLVPMPDVIHVGKSIKCAFSNWFLMMSGFRSALSLIRSLRKNGDPDVKEALHCMLKAEDVRNRDRMAVDPIIRMTKQEVGNTLSSLNKVVCTIIPERMRFEESNKPGMFCPVSICIGTYGFVVFIDYDNKTNKGRVVLARLHYPVTCKVLLNDIADPRNITMQNTIAFVPEYTTGHIRAIATAKDPKLKVTALRKNDLQEELRKRNASTEGNVKELQTRLRKELDETTKLYNDRTLRTDCVNLTNQSTKFVNPVAIVSCEDLLYVADNGIRQICQLAVEHDGVGFVGNNTKILPYSMDWTTVLDMTLQKSLLYVSSDTGISAVNLETMTTRLIMKNNEQCQVTGINMYRDCLIFSDVASGVVKLIDENGSIIDVAGSGAGHDRDGSDTFATLARPYGIACEENTIYVCDTSAHAVKMITNLKETSNFLKALGTFYSAFGIHLKGTKPKNVSLGEARIETLKLHNFLEETASSIRTTFFDGREVTLNGPEGMVSKKTVRSVQLVAKSLQYLEKDLSGVPNVQLQSFLTGQVEHFHATSHIKFDIPTMSQHTRDFHEIIKESIKRIAQWSVHYFTHRDHYYPVPETAIPLANVPFIHKSKPANMTESDIQLMIRWAEKHGKCVRQRTVRGDNTKDKAGTLPEVAYELTERQNQLDFNFPSSGPSNEKMETFEDSDSDDSDTESDHDKSDMDENDLSISDLAIRTRTRSGRNIIPRIRLDL